MNSPAAVRYFSKQCFNKCITSRLMSLQEMPTLQHTSTTKKQEHQDLHDSSVAVMLREMQREAKTGHPFERRLHIDYSTNNHPTWLHEANDTDCCFMAILSWRKPAGPRIICKLWSNLKPSHSMNFREQSADLRERTDYPRGKRTKDISRE